MSNILNFLFSVSTLIRPHPKTKILKHAGICSIILSVQPWIITHSCNKWCVSSDDFFPCVLFAFQKQHLLFSPGVGGIPCTPESPAAQLLYSPFSLNESGSGDEQVKRGRPAANAIQTLISQGSVAESSIRCRFCSRVFPREKSLQAHMRTHTGFVICYRLLVTTVSCFIYVLFFIQSTFSCSWEKLPFSKLALAAAQVLHMVINLNYSVLLSPKINEEKLFTITKMFVLSYSPYVVIPQYRRGLYQIW